MPAHHATRDRSSRVRRLFDRPGAVLALAGLAVAALMAAQMANVLGLSLLAEDAHMVLAPAAAVLALCVAVRRRLPSPLDYAPLAIGLLGILTGMVGVALVPVFGTPAVVAANAFLILGATLDLRTILPALFRSSDRRARFGWILDSSIMTVAFSTLIVTIWRSGAGTDAAPEQFATPAVAALMFASTAMPIIAALSRRILLQPRGIWAAIVACATLSWCWIIWTDAMIQGRPHSALVSLLFSPGMLLLAWAWISWSEESSDLPIYHAVAQRLTDVLPAVSALVCVAIAALPHGDIGPIDPAYLGTVLVVLMILARQRTLILNERESSQRLAREVAERAQATVALERLEPAATPEGTALRICEEAMKLRGIDAAAIYVFCRSDRVVPLALVGRRPENEMLNEPVDTARALHLRQSASVGSWVDPPLESHAFASFRRIDDEDDISTGRLGDGRAEAFAPMHWNDRVVGVVALATFDPDESRRLAERLPTVSEFGVMSAALMGDPLIRRWETIDLQAQIEGLIEQHAFWPVFQAVVRLSDRMPVGYEALTRFRDRSRPDERFAQATEAGIGVRFETACLKAQLEAASWLPPGTWVSVNVSPALATAIVPLVSVLEHAERDLVFEITEHVEIADYERLTHALELVRGRARFAVDDAGAGYAGLKHILELRPQFVKLDLSLVRNIDTDRARQAMVAGMTHFAAGSGCELIAEGIETEGELAELARLGVAFGQGYLFGQPAPVPVAQSEAREAA